MYYRDFSVGFNTWFVLAPVFAVLMIGIALDNVRVTKRARRPFCCLNELGINIIAGGFSAVLCVLMFTESFNGAVQLLDNWSNGEDSPVWSLVIASIGIIILCIIYCAVLIDIASYVQAKKYAKYRAIYEHRLERERRRQERQRQHSDLVIMPEDDPENPENPEGPDDGPEAA